MATPTVGTFLNIGGLVGGLYVTVRLAERNPGMYAWPIIGGMITMVIAGALSSLVQDFLGQGAQDTGALGFVPRVRSHKLLGCSVC